LISLTHLLHNDLPENKCSLEPACPIGKGGRHSSATNAKQGVPICVASGSYKSKSKGKSKRDNQDIQTTLCVDPAVLSDGAKNGDSKKKKSSKEKGSAFPEDYTCGCCDPLVEGPGYPSFCEGEICFGNQTTCSLDTAKSKGKMDSPSSKGMRRVGRRARGEASRDDSAVQFLAHEGTRLLRKKSNKERKSGILICVDGQSECIDNLDEDFLAPEEDIHYTCGPC
jgi:hypothetical protein